MNQSISLMPDWIDDADTQIRAMVQDFPEPRPHEYAVEEAPRELLECMLLTRLFKNVGHAKGLAAEEREERKLILDAAETYKQLLLFRISRQHPELKKRIGCAHVRNDGKIWSRPIRLP